MDLMLNRWLLYQTLGRRVWGRTALYQSSGAFGFRDQLQDVLGIAALQARPYTRADHKFRSASIRSGRCVALVESTLWSKGNVPCPSDDLLWLPYVTAEYVTATGDQSNLNGKEFQSLKGGTP